MFTGIMFAIGAVASAASAFLSGMNNAKNADAQRQAALYNAKQERYAAEQAYMESSVNRSMTAMNGRQDIATGEASMAAAGNIGTSEQIAELQSAWNLDKDLAALYYKYSNEAIQHRNTARGYEYNANIEKRNRNNAIASAYLGAGLSLANSAYAAKGYGFYGNSNNGYYTGVAYGQQTMGVGGTPMYGTTL